MPMSTRERASIAGRASAAARTPQQRKESARRAYLAGAVNTVCDRLSELTPEQVAKVREVFGGASR